MADLRPSGFRPLHVTLRTSLGSADVTDPTVSSDSDEGPGLAPVVAGPFLYTFTGRLPFVLGVADGLDHEIGLPFDYAVEQDADIFRRGPFVRIRIFNAPSVDRKFCPANLPQAVQHFYQADYGSGKEDGPRLYEQWISLETPAVLLFGENVTDPAFAFHRSLSVLNVFLQAFALARDDDRVRPISARELRPIVVIGTLDLSGNWHLQGPMLMHPDAKERPLGSRPVAEHTDALNRAVALILGAEPFIRARQWRMRAERRKYEGEAADAIISFQTAAETLAYELWALLLVDEGLSEAEIASRREAGVPFKSLLGRELAQRLGGQWDLSSDRSAVGRYWARLYLMRNRIVHAGHLPHDGDAEEAEAAFVEFDRFLDSQLRSKAKKFPRATRAKLEGSGTGS